MSESKRQSLHMGMSCFALLLRYLNWWQAMICDGVALAFNLALLPKMARNSLFRKEEQVKGYSLGMTLYPITVGLLIILFRNKLYLAAGCWGILAFGDGLATVAGVRWGKRKWPWNSSRSFVGSLAYFLGGGMAAWGLMLWSAGGWNIPAAEQAYIPLFAAVGAGVAALVETIPWSLDDNITAPLAAGLCLYILSGFLG